MKKILFFLCSFMLLLEASNPVATMETTKGTMVIELRADLAPKAGENFDTGGNSSNYSNYEDFVDVICPGTNDSAIRLTFNSFNTGSKSFTVPSNATDVLASLIAPVVWAFNAINSANEGLPVTVISPA